MKDREKLIEEAAEQLMWATRGDGEPYVDWPADRDDARRMAEVAFEVFEKAYENARPDAVAIARRIAAENKGLMDRLS